MNTKLEAARAERAHVERTLDPPPVPAAKVPTVEEYAESWLARRTNVNAAGDRTRLRRHALPQLGAMAMDAVKPRHLRDLILTLRNEGRLAPRSIRQISGLLHTMFKSAAIEEVITANPVQFERGTLPKKADKDADWRHNAIYTRGEIESLISDERILPDRRILYALKTLAALRHGEAAKLTWSQYDPNANPLGAINLGLTKSGVPRAVPVHPTLAKLLATWRLSGWPGVFGRKPDAADLIVPTRNMTARKAAESQHALVADLKMLGFRTQAGTRLRRRGHDMRRTFITLARTDGAIDGLLRWVTHGPSSDMIDVYTSPPWSALCTEVAKLRVTLKEGALVSLRPTKHAPRWLKPSAEVWPTGGQNRETTPSEDGQLLAVAAQMMATPTWRKAIGTALIPIELLAVPSISERELV